SVSLSDGSVVGFRPEPSVDETEQKKTLRGGVLYLAKANAGDIEEFTLPIDLKGLIRWASRIDSSVPWLTRTQQDLWFDRRTNEMITSYDVVARYSEYLNPTVKRTVPFEEPAWINDIRKKVNVHLIEAQRLFKVDFKDRDFESNSREYT